MLPSDMVTNSGLRSGMMFTSTVSRSQRTASMVRPTAAIITSIDQGARPNEAIDRGWPAARSSRFRSLS